MLKKIFSHLTMLAMVSCQLLFAGSQFSFVHAQETSESDVEEARLIISAVQITGGTGHTQEDFIELYNPTSLPFDLTGHRLVKRTATATTDALVKSWTESTIVPAHHFFLWANSNFSSLPVPADATSTATIADNNGIALRRGSSDVGTIIDDAAWGETANGFTAVSSVNPGANESLMRTDLFEDSHEFAIHQSSPRNSSIEFLPDPQDPPADDPPVDDPPVDDPPADDPPADDPPSDEQLDLKITELYPNPSGSDSGYEKIEIYNSGNSTANLEGLKLDDVSVSEPISSNAYTLPSVDLEPEQFLAVTIPTGKFAMNNTDGDVVTLFDDQNQALSSVSYTGSTPEGKSYSLFNDDEWQWSIPTLGSDNGDMPEPEDEEEDGDDDEQEADYGDYDNSGLQISEIYSTPSAGEAEYVELYNSGEETAQLAVVTVVVGERRKLLPEHEIEPGKYYVIEQSTLPLQLRNSGQDLKLLEGTKLLDSVSYPALVTGTSYARFEDGFLLTTKPTKAAKNILQIPEEVKKETKETAEKTTTKTAKKSATAKTAAKSSAKSKTNSADKATPIKTVSTEPKDAETQINVKPPENNKESVGKIIAMGAAAVTAGLVALYKLVFSAGPQ